MPGIGKTALATTVARAVAADFPDGVVYADLTVPDADQPDDAQAASAVLPAIGQQPRAPARSTDLVTAWRNNLVGERVLLVLDDVRDSAQVGAFLPLPPGCAAIVISRRRLIDLAGAQWCQVDPMSQGEALDFLGQLIGPSRVLTGMAAAQRLVGLCERRPLAVRTAGARLAARPGWSIDEMEQQLRDNLAQTEMLYDDCHVVHAPFESVYRRLTSSQARVFRHAALLAEPETSASDVAEALRISVHEARAALESLADLHLVRAGAYDRYTYDSLVRLYALRQAARAGAPRIMR